jgi:apolipoprotein N-acyltransferase
VVAVIQGNPRQAWTWSRAAAEHALVAYSRLSREALAAVRPDLLVWPEYAITLYPATDPVLMPALTTLALDTTAGLVFGAPRVAHGTTYRNSTYHLGPDGGWTSYDKIRLVPFAEYQPFAVGEAVAGEDERIFTPGTRASVFASALGRLGPLICYEAIFPERARALAHAGAEVLLNLSNDGWLDRAGLGAGAQHLSIVVFRAVETRRYLVRAAASGISGFVDPTGRPFALLAEGERGFTSGLVHPRRDLTFYVRYGDVFAATCALLALAALVRTRREVAA